MSDVSNVHAKLAEVHMQLMGMKIKKTGHNAHKHFDYYELSDIIPPVTQECHKQGLTLEFAFCEDVAILKIERTKAIKIVLKELKIEMCSVFLY